MFPVLREAVWDLPFVEGENEERTRMRSRWTTVTRHMNPEAVAIIQRAQPIGVTPDDEQIHVIDILNRYSNRDRHTTLSVVTSALTTPQTSCTIDGTRWFGHHSGFGSNDALKDGAVIHVPDGAVDVTIEGTAMVIISMGQNAKPIPIPAIFRELLHVVRTNLTTPLAPYLTSDIIES
jgi:hypothetical protein